MIVKFPRMTFKISSAIVFFGHLLNEFYYYYYRAIAKISNHLYESFLFDKNDIFNDFFAEVSIAKDLRPYSGIWSVHFPFAYIVAFPFSLIPKWISILLFFLIFISFLFWMTVSVLGWDKIRKSWIDLMTIFSLCYPILFAIDRGNFEIVVFMATASSLIFFLRDKIFISVVLLSFAAAMKLYPLFFSFLYLRRKNKNVFFSSILLTFFIMFLSLFLFRDPIDQSVAQFISWHKNYKLSYAIGNAGLYYGCSLWGVLKISMIYFGFKEYLQKLYFFYTLIIFILSGFTVIFVQKLKDSVEAIYLMICAVILFPHVSADYKLLLIIFPYLMLFSPGYKSKIRNELIFWTTLLFIPKNFFFGVTMGVYLNPILLVLVMLTILRSAVRSGGEDTHPSTP